MKSQHLYRMSLKLLLEEYDLQFAQDETSIGMNPINKHVH